MDGKALGRASSQRSPATLRAGLCRTCKGTPMLGSLLCGRLSYGRGMSPLGRPSKMLERLNPEWWCQRALPPSCAAFIGESFATEINGRLVPCKPLLMSTEQKKSALVRLGYFGEASYTSIGEPFDTKRAGASTPGLGLPCGRRLGPSPALASTDNATQSMRVY